MNVRHFRSIVSMVIGIQVLALPCFAVEVRDASVNVVQNGDFREASSEASLPRGWEFRPAGQGRRIPHPDIEGKFCLQIKSDREGFDPAAVQRGIQVRSGKRYRLSYRVRSGGGSKETTGYQFFRVYTTYEPPIRGNVTYGGVAQQDGAEWQDAFEQWQNRTLEFRTPDKEFSAMTLSCQIRGPGTIYFDDVKLECLVEEGKKSFIRIDIRSPWYRDTIFASTPVDQIQGLLTFDHPLAQRGLLQLIDEKQNCLCRQEFPKRSSIEFSIPARDLPVGDYHLRVQLFDDKDVLLEENTKSIRKLPRRPNEVVFRSDRVLLMNGKPLFPIGVWGFVSNEAYVYEFCRSGFNTFVQAPHEKANLDLAHRFGAKLLVSISDKLPFAHNPPNRRQWTKQYLDRYDSLFDHPALLGYFLADEPLWCGAPLEELLDSYDFHRRVNTYRPVLISEAPRNSIPELAAYANACDIDGVDIYPVPDGSHSEMTDKTISCVGKYTEKMRNVVADRKPIWITLQGFSWIHLSQPDHPKAIYPTFNELRFMAYDAIIHGATGVLFWGTDHIVNPDYWDVLFKVTSELRDISAVLVSPTAADSAVTSNHQDVKILHKQCQGQNYFFIENTGKNTIQPKISTSLETGKLNVVFENRRVEMKDGVFVDDFGPYAVHIYTTAASTPPPLVLPPRPDKRLEGKGFLKEMRNLTDGFPSYNGSAKWIWLKSPSNEPIREAFFVKEITLSEPARSATIVITADDTFTLSVNGQCAGDARKSRYPGWAVMKRYDLSPHLKPGRNVLIVHVEDLGSNICAGLLCDLAVKTISGKGIHIVSDESWLAIQQLSKDALKEIFENGRPSASVIGPYGTKPWGTRVRIEPEN